MLSCPTDNGHCLAPLPAPYTCGNYPERSNAECLHYQIRSEDLVTNSPIICEKDGYSDEKEE